MTPEAHAHAESAPRTRELWAPLRWLLARYIQFWSVHRLLGSVGCLGGVALFIGVCGIVGQLAGRLQYGPPPESAPISPLERIEVNAVGSVTNDPVGPVDEYIAGMRAFDAQRMWSAYNEQVRGELTSRGQGLDVLQRGLTEARSRGATMDAAVQVGNYPLRDGRRYVFYVVTRSGFASTSTPEQLYFIFTVDPAGRILSIT